MSVNQFTRVCVACEVEMKTSHTGAILVEAATWGFMAIYRCDVQHCPVCGIEVVIGVARDAEFGHWEGDVVAEVKRREARGERIVLCWLNDREKSEFMRHGKEAEKTLKVASGESRLGAVGSLGPQGPEA